MPEGPEIHMASKFINRICANRLFTGNPEKSAVNKNVDVPWSSPAYRILSKSRGKELMLTLTADVDTKGPQGQTIDLLFHFGMSGFFKFTSVNQIPKHAHLKFYTLEDKPPMILSFVDTRRFGGWKVSSAWSPDRGPDPVFEYEQFRENILNNLKDTTFNKAICEVLLNQSYFNGIGNYLRAEILHRANIPPFQDARTVLEALFTVKHEGPDLLQLCQSVPLEVINLGGANILVYDPDSTEEDIKPFADWLQCYNKTSMNKMQDHNKRTIWFHGKPGPLAPKQNKSSRISRGKKDKKKEKFSLEDKTLENVGNGKNSTTYKTKNTRKLKTEVDVPPSSNEQDETSIGISKSKNRRRVKKEADIPSSSDEQQHVPVRFTRSRTKILLP